LNVSYTAQEIVLKVEKAFKNGERGWSSEVKEKLISILENGDFYGDL
jgi:hypothetical protein